jgi:hypothetical protein
MKRNFLVLGLILAAVTGASVNAALPVRSFNLTQLGVMKYGANPAGQPKTPAQTAVDFIKSVGGNHVVLNPEARMANYGSNEIIPVTPLGLRPQERTNYLNLMNYIHSQGMTVGIRPIILLERMPGDTEHWHGNIKPSQPFDWFKSLENYLNIYGMIAKLGKADEFTVGAELMSMTVGVEQEGQRDPDQWTYGFPREWVILINKLSGGLKAANPKMRIMYDINYTDQTVNQDGTGPSGGELERWRYRLVDLKPNPAIPATMTPQGTEAWNHMAAFWNAVDAIGIDMYRSLMPRNEKEPSEYNALVAKLQERTEQFASDIDYKMLDIENAVGVTGKKIIIKEIGYKACTRCFIDPFSYDNPNLTLNVEHQAAAYEAFLNAFAKPNWSWMLGISWWDVAVDPKRAGPQDPGFNPRGKTHTENVLRQGWN